jgi:hypothetical protein
MAIKYPIPEKLSQNWTEATDWLTRLLGNVFDPNRNASPPNIQGMDVGPMPGPPQSLPELISILLMGKPIAKQGIINNAR